MKANEFYVAFSKMVYTYIEKEKQKSCFKNYTPKERGDIQLFNNKVKGTIKIRKENDYIVENVKFILDFKDKKEDNDLLTDVKKQFNNDSLFGGIDFYKNKYMIPINIRIDSVCTDNWLINIKELLGFVEDVESYIRRRNDNINLTSVNSMEEVDDIVKDDCKFLTISENNMDFLIMENLYDNPEFIKLFLDKIAINDYTIYQIEHSKKGAYGESDITVMKYIKHIHDTNTKFWKKYQNFCKNEYPELSLCEKEERGRSYKENWVKYNSGIDNVLFRHKFMRGHVDIEFTKSIDKVSSPQQLLIEMEKLIKSILPYYKEAGIFIELIGKNSAAYRMYVPILDPMKDSFSVCEKKGWVKSSFRAINLFDRLLKEHKDEFKNLREKIYSKEL